VRIHTSFAVASYCSFTATPASDRWVLKLMLMPDL